MPNRSWPDGTRPCHARPNLNAPRHIYSPKRAAGSLLQSSVLPSVTIAGPRRASPNQSRPRPSPHRRAMTHLVHPLKESSRGSRNLLCCRLQLLPCRTLQKLAEPDPTETNHVRSPKRAAGSLLRSSVLPSATVAKPRHASPCLNSPDLTQPRPPSKESSREPFRAQCCRLQLLPGHALP